MFSKITMTQRFNAGLALAVVIVLVFATNRIDQRHFETTQNTVDAVFHDRVVAQNYIYQINNIMADIRIQIQTDSFRSTQSAPKEQLNVLLDNFAQTKLTLEEARLNYLLQEQIEELNRELEKRSIESYEITDELSTITLAHIKNIQENLDDLAEIQLNESGRLTSVAQKSLKMTSIISNLEIAVLIIAGIALQFVIFYRHCKKTDNNLS